MYTYNWYQWLLIFYIYCFFGWIFESTYVSLRQRRFVNRGFLRIPMLPLYGTGAVMMLWVSLPVRNQLPLVFLLGMAAATLLEYVTGWTMEQLFKVRYWDYSNQRFNFHGYICLSSSVAWGFLTIFLTEVIHRPVARLIVSLHPVPSLALAGGISVLFAADTVQSVRTALNLAKVLEAATRIRGEVDELQVQLALMKAEMTSKAEVLEESARSRMENAAARVSAALENRPHSAEEGVELLSQRLDELTEKRRQLSTKMDYYRRSLLNGNPTATSARFNEALKELRENARKRMNH